MSSYDLLSFNTSESFTTMKFYSLLINAVGKVSKNRVAVFLQSCHTEVVKHEFCMFFGSLHAKRLPCRLTRLESERRLKLRPGTPCSRPVTQPGPSP